MQYNPYRIEYKKEKQWVNIVPIGDVHLGNAGADIPRLKKYIDWIADHEFTYWLGMGDYIEAINYTDPRFDPKSVSARYMTGGNIDKMIQMQIDDIVDLFKPIKDKCLGLHRGNHEEAVRKYYHFDVLYEMWKGLDVSKDTLLYDSAITRLKFSKYTKKIDIDVFSCHGNVGGRKSGNKINRLEDMLMWYDADIYLMAHSHIKAAALKNRLRFNTVGDLVDEKKVLAVTGCFLRGYKKDCSIYTERWLYPPTDIGVVKIQVQPSTRDIHVSI